MLKFIEIGLDADLPHLVQRILSLHALQRRCKK